MFGIKTKKDKKIEELQKEIDRLKTMPKPTTITYQNVAVNTLCSEFTLPIEALEAMPEEHIKRVLATDIINELEKNLEIEHTTDNYKGLEIYKAKLKVIKM